MTTTTLASVMVVVMAIVAGALWLGKPLPRDIDLDELEDDSRRPADLRASMERHPSAQPAPLGRITVPPPARAPTPPMAATPRLHAQARVVFAGVQDGHLLLDCVIADSDRGPVHVPAGLPITLSLGALDTPWMAVHIESLLERWAEGERVVDLELLDSPLGPRATLVSASSRVVLPLSTVAGLS